MKANLTRPGTLLITSLAPIAWGTTYLTITESLPVGMPLFVATARVVPAGVVLLLAGRAVSPWRPRGREWRQMFLIGLCNFGVFFPLLTAAVYRLPGGVAAAAGGLGPLLVAVLGRAITGRRSTRRELVVGAVAAFGVVMVVVRPGAHLDPVGVLAAVAANVSFAIAVVLTKRAPTPANRLAATGWQLLLGGAVMVPIALLTDGVPAVLSMRNVVGFVWLSLGCTAAAFVVWFDGIRRLPAAAPPLLALAAPITGAALGWIVLDQSLSVAQILGFVITLAAIAAGTIETVRRHAIGELTSGLSG